jgi:hypothetical protein
MKDGGDPHNQAVAAPDAPIMGLRYGQCRYVTGTNAEGWATFCCEPAHKGSYCRKHHKLCYRGFPKDGKAMPNRPASRPAAWSPRLGK